MSDAEKIEMLSDALEAIREATFKPYQPPDYRANFPTPMDVKIAAWAKIQSIAARALRDVKENA
jgi:hypothetical protein